MDVNPGISAEEVLTVIGWLVDSGAVHEITGGWAEDALVGKQTRPHRDLDVCLDHDAIDEFVTWLSARGYALTAKGPLGLELCGPAGCVFVHPMAIRSNGDGVEKAGRKVAVHPAEDRSCGIIGGKPVTVASKRRLEELRALQAAAEHA